MQHNPQYNFLTNILVYSLFLSLLQFSPLINKKVFPSTGISAPVNGKLTWDQIRWVRCLNRVALCGSALSWCEIQEWVHKSRHFSSLKRLSLQNKIRMEEITKTDQTIKTILSLEGISSVMSRSPIFLTSMVIVLKLNHNQPFPVFVTNFPTEILFKNKIWNKLFIYPLGKSLRTTKVYLVIKLVYNSQSI